MLVADNPSVEGGLEGSVQFADNGVRLLEDSTKAASNSVIPSYNVERTLPSSFPSGTIAPDGTVTFSPEPANFGSDTGLGNVGSSPLQMLGEQISGMLQSLASAMPGMGFLTALFEFISNLFTSFATAAFDPKVWAQQAQASIDAMNKLKAT
ncbi:MAG TPA: hypothetical protein V6C86_16750 [Oculatellaceae cyanobacterium]